MIIKEGTEFLDQLKDKVHEQQREIERLTAESTEWESKYYEEVKKNSKAIEYLEKKSKELEWWDTDFMMTISILKGDSNER